VKRITLLIVTAALAGCATPEIAVNSHADFGKIQRVAVATFGGPAGDIAADMLSQDLLNRGADVVERQRLDALLDEQHLGSNHVLDPATIKKVGKILGVDAIFVGNVVSNVPSQSYLVTTSRRHSYTTVTPVGSGGVTGLEIPDSQVVTSAAQSALIARMVDVESGSILWSGRMSYEGYDLQSAMSSITASFAKSLVPLWPTLHP
jgi:hypothetical protein